MFPELVKYKQIKQQYEEQLQRLKKEQDDLEEEKEEMLQQYEKLLGKVDMHHQDESLHRSNISNLRTEIQGLTEDLGDVLEQSSHLSKAKKERLNEWITPLQRGLDREVLAANQHLKLKKDEFRRYRIELFLLVQQAYEIEEYIMDIHRSYTQTCKEYLTNQEIRTIKLQAIQVRKDVTHMLDELQNDLDYVQKHSKLPNWVEETINRNHTTKV